MKKISSILCLLCLSFTAFSQFEVGPRVGLGTVFTDVENTSENIESGDANFGLSLGVFTRINFDIIAIMPEVLYSTQTTSINFQDDNGAQQVAESELNKIDVPVNLVINPGKLLNVQAGLIGSYTVESEDGFVNKTEEAIRNYKEFTFGYQAGLGLELGNFLIDLRYEGNLSDVSEARENSLGIAFDERQEMVKAILGIKLF